MCELATLAFAVLVSNANSKRIKSRFLMFRLDIQHEGLGGTEIFNVESKVFVWLDVHLLDIEHCCLLIRGRLANSQQQH